MIKMVADTAKRNAKAWSKWSLLLDPSSSHHRAIAAASGVSGNDIWEFGNGNGNG